MCEGVLAVHAGLRVAAFARACEEQAAGALLCGLRGQRAVPGLHTRSGCSMPQALGGVQRSPSTEHCDPDLICKALEATLDDANHTFWTRGLLDRAALPTPEAIRPERRACDTAAVSHRPSFQGRQLQAEMVVDSLSERKLEQSESSRNGRFRWSCRELECLHRRTWSQQCSDGSSLARSRQHQSRLSTRHTQDALSREYFQRNVGDLR